jgi:hypothetical protein
MRSFAWELRDGERGYACRMQESGQGSAPRFGLLPRFPSLGSNPSAKGGRSRSGIEQYPQKRRNRVIENGEFALCRQELS